jgi:hypothetical protein
MQDFAFGSCPVDAVACMCNNPGNDSPPRKPEAPILSDCLREIPSQNLCFIDPPNWNIGNLPFQDFRFDPNTIE